jgi:hypothetical protein
MDLHTWLDAETGRSSWLAQRLDRSKTAVSLWREDGVPLTLIPRIAEVTDGAVSADEMLRHAMACKLAAEQKRASERGEQAAA